MEPAAGDVSGRRLVLNADEGIEPLLLEAADDLVGQLPDVGEPEGFCRADGELVRRREVGGDHNGAPLRQERTGAGVRGLRPRPSVAPAAARETGGSDRGTAPPSPAPNVQHWVGWLSCLSGHREGTKPALSRATKSPKSPLSPGSAPVSFSLQLEFKLSFELRDLACPDTVVLSEPFESLSD